MIAYNPYLVTSGLITCVDAVNTKSYPGSGSTWYDLSGNGNDVSLTPIGSKGGTPTYSTSGYFQFSNDSSFVNKDVFNLTTLTLVVTCTVGTGVPAGQTDKTWGMAGVTSNSLAARTSSGITNQVSWTFPTSVSGMNQFAIAYTGSNVRFYRNGAFGGQVAGTTTANHSVLILGCEWDSSGGETNFYTGNIAQVLVYDRALADEEITKNYHGIRGRYNI
jgi:hypothetical protein